jgi:hypothetical protein
MPTLSQSHISQALSTFAVQFIPQGSIANRIAPTVTVQKASDYYYKVDPQRAAMRQSSDIRGLNGEAANIDWATGTDLYSCQEHTLQQPLDDRLIANADPALDIKTTASASVMSGLTLNKEIALAAALTTAVTQTAAAAAVWTGNLSVPIEEITTGIKAIRDATGVRPNFGWCDYSVYLALINHPDIVSRVMYSQVATQENLDAALARVLGLEQVWVGDVFKNTSMNATPSLSRVWGTTFWLGRVQANPGLQTQTLVTTFAWAGAPGVGGVAIDEYRDDKKKSDVVRGSWSYDQKVIDASLGYRITGCVS